MRPLLIFDLDGTLVDSRADIAASINVGLVAAGRATLPPKDLVPFIGRPLLEIFVVLLGDRDPGQARAEAACEAYRRHYFEHCADGSTLYPGVLETLRALKTDYRLAVATTKKTFMAERVIELFGLAPLFDAVLGTDDLPYKPDPAILLALLARFATPPAQALMVGDTRADVLAAQNAGMACAAALYGIGEARELLALAPTFSLTSFAELPAQIARLWPCGEQSGAEASHALS